MRGHATYDEGALLDEGPEWQGFAYQIRIGLIVGSTLIRGQANLERQACVPNVLLDERQGLCLSHAEVPQGGA
jgi:hypothetical protein